MVGLRVAYMLYNTRKMLNTEYTYNEVDHSVQLTHTSTHNILVLDHFTRRFLLNLKKKLKKELKRLSLGNEVKPEHRETPHLSSFNQIK